MIYDYRPKVAFWIKNILSFHFASSGNSINVFSFQEKLGRTFLLHLDMTIQSSAPFNDDIFYSSSFKVNVSNLKKIEKIILLFTVNNYGG